MGTFFIQVILINLSKLCGKPIRSNSMDSLYSSTNASSFVLKLSHLLLLIVSFFKTNMTPNILSLLTSLAALVSNNSLTTSFLL